MPSFFGTFGTLGTIRRPNDGADDSLFLAEDKPDSAILLPVKAHEPWKFTLRFAVADIPWREWLAENGGFSCAVNVPYDSSRCELT